MSEKNRTASILQRIPMILAVTAASYGLALPAGARTHTQAPLKAPQAQTAQQR